MFLQEYDVPILPVYALKHVKFYLSNYQEIEERDTYRNCLRYVQEYVDLYGEHGTTSFEAWIRIVFDNKQ